MEYACPVYHNSLTSYLSEDLDAIQKRAMRTIHPGLDYDEALAKHNLQPLAARRGELTKKLYQSIIIMTKITDWSNSCLTPVNITIIYVKKRNLSPIIKPTDFETVLLFTIY